MVQKSLQEALNAPREVTADPVCEEYMVTTGCLGLGSAGNEKKETVAIQWNGVFNIGTALTVSDSCKEMWTTFVNGKKVEWRPGFHSQRVVGDKSRYIIDCKVLKNSGDSTGEMGPLFSCTCHRELDPAIANRIVSEDDVLVFESTDGSKMVRDMLTTLRIHSVHYKHCKSVEEFFGLHMKRVCFHVGVAEPTACHSTSSSPGGANSNRSQYQLSGVWQQAHHILRRNAGPPSSLSARFFRQRMNITYSAVRTLTEGEVATFVTFLARDHPDILLQGLWHPRSDIFLRQLREKLGVHPPVSSDTPIRFSEREREH